MLRSEPRGSMRPTTSLIKSSHVALGDSRRSYHSRSKSDSGSLHPSRCKATTTRKTSLRQAKASFRFPSGHGPRRRPAISSNRVAFNGRRESPLLHGYSDARAAVAPLTGGVASVPAGVQAFPLSGGVGLHVGGFPLRILSEYPCNIIASLRQWPRSARPGSRFAIPQSRRGTTGGRRHPGRKGLVRVLSCSSGCGACRCASRSLSLLLTCSCLHSTASARNRGGPRLVNIESATRSTRDGVAASKRCVSLYWAVANSQLSLHFQKLFLPVLERLRQRLQLWGDFGELPSRPSLRDTPSRWRPGAGHDAERSVELAPVVLRGAGLGFARRSGFFGGIDNLLLR